jgi:hypothetical protein
VEQMLKRVTAEVERATDGKQQPERLSRLKTELWLKEAEADDFQAIRHMGGRRSEAPGDGHQVEQRWHC